MSAVANGADLVVLANAAPVQVLKKYYKSDDEAAMGATYDFMAGEVLPVLPLPNQEQFADAMAQLTVSDPKIKDVDLTKLLDTSFVQNAADRGVGAAIPAYEWLSEGGPFVPVPGLVRLAFFRAQRECKLDSNSTER